MEVDIAKDGVRGILHTPNSSNKDPDALVLTHGAGSNCNAPLLLFLARAFAHAGYLVVRYDLPYRQQRPKGPPLPAGAARDRENVGKVVRMLRALTKGRIFAGGHSYGGRQTAMAAAESPGLVEGLLLLSYPLHPPSKPELKQTSYFPDLRTPALFVQGTFDPFGSLDELREALALIPAPTGLLAAEDAGHDLKRAPEFAAQVLERFAALFGQPS
jgi:predicted alpha/beta-hydrolase family hydrolase